MRGRVVFKILKPLLNISSLIIRFLPNFIKLLMWNMVSIFDGKFFVGLRYILLKSLCKNVGDNVYVGKYVVIKNTNNIEIGNNVSIHDFCYMEGLGGISIGNDVSIAHNCSILSTNHTWSNIDLPIKYNTEILGKVHIEDDVWIGCGVRILSDITINKRCVVAAGAVVNKSIDSECLYGGVPAKFIKKL